MDASTCLATYALPRRLSLKPDQRAIRSSIFCRMAVYRAVTASAGSLDSGMPKCFTLAPCAAKAIPVVASGPARWLKLPRLRPWDLPRCSLEPVAAQWRSMLVCRMTCASLGLFLNAGVVCVLVHYRSRVSRGPPDGLGEGTCQALHKRVHCL